MTDDILDKLEALAEKATGGRWLVEHVPRHGYPDASIWSTSGQTVCRVGNGDGRAEANAFLIASCEPLAIKYLVARCRAADKLADEASKTLRFHQAGVHLLDDSARRGLTELLSTYEAAKGAKP